MARELRFTDEDGNKFETMVSYSGGNMLIRPIKSEPKDTCDEKTCHLLTSIHPDEKSKSWYCKTHERPFFPNRKDKLKELQTRFLVGEDWKSMTMDHAMSYLNDFMEILIEERENS